MKYIDYIIIASLVVYIISALMYYALALFGHKLPRRIDYRLQDASMIGMSFIILTIVAAIIKLVIL